MKVAKFGGSSLANATQIRKVAAIIRDDPDRRIIVVSAPGRQHQRDAKVTDLLIHLARAALVHDHLQEAFDAVVERFRSIIVDLHLDPVLLEDLTEDLRKRLNHERHDEHAFVDQITAFGEDQCAHIVAACLRSMGIDADYVSPWEAGLRMTDNEGPRQVLTSSYGTLRALREHNEIVVFPGFFGYTEGGQLVTFSRGGSDISGAILAAAVSADVYENFTDTDGIYSADPRVVSKPKRVTEITFQEMRELAYAGFSVFHDEALEPVVRAGIPVNVRNTNRASLPGTMIVDERKIGNSPIIGISGMTGICLVYVSRYLMNREVGFGRRLLAIFEDEGVPFEHMPTGIDNLSLVIREENFSAAAEARVLHRIIHELDAEEVRVEHDLALVMAVGEGMKHQIGTAARACQALARAEVNLEMINQGSSEVSMIFGIHRRQLKAAINALHRTLVNNPPRRRGNA